MSCTSRGGCAGQCVRTTMRSRLTATSRPSSPPARANGTAVGRLAWITPRVMRAFADLFDAGYAHSFEVWNGRGELAGGGYGLALGRTFITESQFSREPNTSKMGFT